MKISPIRLLALRGLSPLVHSLRSQDILLIVYIKLYRGSVTDECDPRVCGTDFVSCIELIEHINEDEHCYFTKTIFESLKPRYAVITTPNREFNQHWPNLR